MEGVLAIMFIFGGAGLCIFAMTPIGKAIAARIRGSAITDVTEVQETLQAIMDESRELYEDNRTLHEEIAELNERLDFAERLLASGEKGKLYGGRHDRQATIESIRGKHRMKRPGDG